MPKMIVSSVVDVNCVVRVSMNRAPPLARSCGVEARYWEGCGWVGMTKKKKRKENYEEEKEEKRALLKTFYKISLLQHEPQKACLFSNKMEQKLQAETAIAAKSADSLS